MKLAKTHVRIAIVIALIAALALAGCSSGPGEKISGNDTGDLRRLVLEDDGVVCYVSYEGESSDLSCLPMNQTNVTPGAANGS